MTFARFNKVMVSKLPQINRCFSVIESRVNLCQSEPSFLDNEYSKKVKVSHLIEECIDGIAIITENQELLYINERARHIFRKLNSKQSSLDEIPLEILHLAEFTIESGRRFPHQSWMTEFQVFTQDSVAVRIRVQYLQLEEGESPCLAILMEDLYKPIEKIALAEAEQYGLTPREKEVWLLQRANYTYKQIASELYITPNTVKKHMKSIYCKRKAYLRLD